MKHTIKLIFSIVCALLLLLADSTYAARKKAKKKNGKRAAATSLSGGDSSSSMKKASSGGKKLKSSKKKYSSSKKKKSSGSSDNEVEEDSDVKNQIASVPEAKCLNDSLSELLKNECSFLNEADVLKGMNQPLLCAYSYKSNSKAKSVTEYFVSKKYGIQESGLKKDTSITVEDGKKVGSAYYKYILDSLKDNSLKESKILDSVTEEVLDQSDIDGTTSAAIESRSVDSTKIVADIVSSNIDSCKKAAKKIVQSCSATNSEEAQNLIAGSCAEYEASLTKQTAKLKNDVYEKAPELLEILKKRTSMKSNSSTSTKTNDAATSTAAEK